jgi:PAS domain S-box-containing protein
MKYSELSKQELISKIEELEKEISASKENEFRFKNLSDAALGAIFLSEKGVCIDQNSTAEKMFGYTFEEAFGRMGTEWIVPEDREKVLNNMLSGYDKP